MNRHHAPNIHEVYLYKPTKVAYVVRSMEGYKNIKQVEISEIIKKEISLLSQWIEFNDFNKKFIKLNKLGLVLYV